MAAALRGVGVRGGAGDRTIVLPGRPTNPEPGPGTLSFNRETMDTLERRLAEYVGPIARHLVASAVRSRQRRRAVRHARRQDRAPAARDRFEREMKAQMKSSVTMTRTGAGHRVRPGARRAGAAADGARPLCRPGRPRADQARPARGQLARRALAEPRRAYRSPGGSDGVPAPGPALIITRSRHHPRRRTIHACGPFDARRGSSAYADDDVNFRTTLDKKIILLLRRA